ncbi:MAG TPA: zinc finger CCHC domain-containing protein [Chlamydiales bacterium]|nr:zinc finger CCHC domain-containing protein [Chlamydiales bacterium]
MVCHRCGQPGHFRNQCPQRYDVRFMTTDEIEDHLQEQFVQKDVATLEIAHNEGEEAALTTEREGQGDFQEDHE